MDKSIDKTQAKLIMARPGEAGFMSTLAVLALEQGDVQGSGFKVQCFKKRVF